MTFVDGVIAWISTLPFAAAVGLVLFVAGAKYVIIPVPTDIITVITAFLAGRKGWPLLPLVGGYLVGSALGILSAHRLGIWLAGVKKWPSLLERARPHIDKVVDQFRTRGLRLIATNRFLPVVRDFAVIAAGMAGVSRGVTLLWAMVSSTLWAVVVFGISATAGSNWDLVVERFSKVGTVSWILLVLLGAIVVFLRWRLRQRRKAAQ